MRPYTLRVLSSLMNATEKQTSAILAEREAEIPHGILSYAGAYKVLRVHGSDPNRALSELVKWRDDKSVSPRTLSFRLAVFPHLHWCCNDVLPRISRIIESLEGDRGRWGRPLLLASEFYTGGFHARVEWEDGSERLVYFLGPGWTRKRIRNMMILLMIKAEAVYHMPAACVVLVDLRRREVHELTSLSAAERNLAFQTAFWLRSYIQKRAS